MSEPVNDDLLPEHVEVDASLAAARREHADRLAAVLDLDAGLAAILTSDENTDHAWLVGGADPSIPASSRPGPLLPDGQAAAIIVIRARDLGLGLARAREDARDLAGALDSVRGLDRAPDLDRARAIGRVIGRNLADELIRILDRVLDRDLDRDLHRDLDRILRLVRGFARVLTRDLDRARVLARDLDRQIQGAFDRVDELVGQLHEVEVDASGADMSALDLADMSVLEGVVWTEETTWPPGVREQVRLRSRVIRPGTYQVRGGDEQDPAELVTT